MLLLVFFHASIKRGSRRNSILTFKNGDGGIKGVSGIRLEMFNYFSNLLKEFIIYRPCLVGVTFNSLSEEDNHDLTSLFLPLKLDWVVAKYDGNKNHGFDGFSFYLLEKILE